MYAQSRCSLTMSPYRSITDFDLPNHHLLALLGVTVFEICPDLWHQKLHSLGLPRGNAYYSQTNAGCKNLSHNGYVSHRYHKITHAKIIDSYHIIS